MEDDDLHGATVVIERRLEDRGEVELKGFDRPVQAWAVRWDH